VIVASGGLSHFPGTDRYAHPDLEWDTRALERLERGNLRSLMGYDERELDETGNIELRCWAVAAGALGERKPDVVQLDPSWHHTYASLGWHSPVEEEGARRHYPNIAPHLVGLTDALHALANDAGARKRYLTDPAAFAEAVNLPTDQARLLETMDKAAMVEMGVHPLLPFLAEMHLRRMKAGHDA
jgi:2,3-dihydroxyphenylpropionate 1,2-dioxygenase